jgi:phage-related baseplate assembly protein
MRDTKSEPLLWTTGLMAPEAYTLKAALDGWARAESDESIRQRAAGAYDKYQKCGLRAALRLFSSVW